MNELPTENRNYLPEGLTTFLSDNLFAQLAWRFFSALVAVLTAAWLFIEFISGHVLGTQPLSNSGGLGVTTIILAAAVLGLLWAMLYQFVESIEQNLFVKLLARFVLAFLAVLTLSWLLIEFVLGYVMEEQPLAESGYPGVAIVLLAGATIALIITMIFQHIELQNRFRQGLIDQAQSNGAQNQELTDTFIESIEAAYKEKRWGEVVKIGGVLSRPLWITGQHELRVRLGEMLENAAAYTQNREVQASVLIDDLGWTNFELGHTKEAEKNITSGIQLAETHGYPFIAYKGHRHLSGIATRRGDLDSAEHHLTKSEEFANLIQDDQVRQEVVAGLAVNYALLFMRRRQWQPAIDKLEEARVIYQDAGDKDREVKLYSFIGDSYFGMGENQAAKNWYREGLARARQESRKDGILTNNIGLAQVAEDEKEYKDAARAYLEAVKIANELGRHELEKELQTKADLFKNLGNG